MLFNIFEIIPLKENNARYEHLTEIDSIDIYAAAVRAKYLYPDKYVSVRSADKNDGNNITIDLKPIHFPNKVKFSDLFTDLLTAILLGLAFAGFITALKILLEYCLN